MGSPSSIGERASDDLEARTDREDRGAMLHCLRQAAVGPEAIGGQHLGAILSSTDAVEVSLWKGL